MHVEAIQWVGSNFDEVSLFAPEKVNVVHQIRNNTKNLELLAGQDGETGWVPVPVGSWIVKWTGDNSDLWPMDDERFQAKYEPV